MLVYAIKLISDLPRFVVLVDLLWEKVVHYYWVRKTWPDTLKFFGVFKDALGGMGLFPSVSDCFRVQMQTPILLWTYWKLWVLMPQYIVNVPMH